MTATAISIQLNSLENRLTSLERLVSVADRLEQLQDALGKTDTRQRVIAVVEACCEGLSGAIRIKRQDVFARLRTERVIIVRHAAMLILYEDLGMTLMQVGDAFARDHGTIINAIRGTKDRAETDKPFREKLWTIRENVRTAIKDMDTKREGLSISPH